MKREIRTDGIRQKGSKLKRCPECGTMNWQMPKWRMCLNCQGEWQAQLNKRITRAALMPAGHLKNPA
jgi:hypothetical protein